MAAPSPFRLSQAARVLRSGGIVAYPTEAVWGLGCDPLNADAVFRLLELKQRPVHKGLILIAASTKQLEPFIGPAARLPQAVRDSWPGPVTWVVPALEGTPNWLTGGRDSIAVRVTDHPLASSLCRAFGGPVVSTSANLSGQSPARTSLQVRIRVGRHIDALLNGRLGDSDRPTTILDASTGAVIRN